MVVCACLIKDIEKRIGIFLFRMPILMLIGSFPMITGIVVLLNGFNLSSITKTINMIVLL